MLPVEWLGGLGKGDGVAVEHDVHNLLSHLPRQEGDPIADPVSGSSSIIGRVSSLSSGGALSAALAALQTGRNTPPSFSLELSMELSSSSLSSELDPGISGGGTSKLMSAAKLLLHFRLSSGFVKRPEGTAPSPESTHDWLFWDPDFCGWDAGRRGGV